MVKMSPTSKILRTNFLSPFGLVCAIGFSINYCLATPDQMWVQSMFADIPASGKNLLPDLDDAYGVVFRDINKDNQPDIYVVRFRDLNRLFINQGKDRPFIDRTIESGLGGNLASRGQKNLELGASAVDFDNDGIQDILIAGWDHTTRLFNGEGNNHYSDITGKTGLDLPSSGNAGIWADIDLDGDLDLFITDEHRENHLYIQIKPGRFEERAREYGIDAEQISQGAAFGDLDNDGYPDLYVCNWFAPDLIYRNLGGIVFQRIKLPLPHLTDPLRSNGVWFGDIDNDADLDILVTDRQRTSRLYRNDIVPGSGTWKFSDITEQSGLLNNYPSYSGLMADFNNDGWQDIFFTNIGPNQLFLNQGGKKFVSVYLQNIPNGSRLLHYSTGAAVADYDNDGDLDLFISNKDTASTFYINPLKGGKFIRFRVIGGKSNRDGIGTKIRLYHQFADDSALELAGYRELSAGQGYLSVSENIAHFGIEPQGSYRAEVRFPSGKEVVLNNLAAGQELLVAEHNSLVMLAFGIHKTISKMLARPEFLVNFILLLLLAGTLGGYANIALRRYTWSTRQAIGLVAGILLFLFIGFIFVPEYGLRAVLWGQLVLLLIIIGSITGFSERILQLSAKRYGYRPVLRKFSEQLIFIRDNLDLYQQLVDTVHKTMETRFCALYQISDRTARSISSAGKLAKQPPVLYLSDGQYDLIKQDSIIEADQIETYFNSLYIDGGHLIVSLRLKNEPLALLILGERKNRLEYKGDDHDVLAILAGQAALAIENNRFIDETRILAEQVSEARTREKYVAELEEKNQSLEKLYQDLKTTQLQLIQSEKMSSLGQLVAGIAHELNNPIGFIYANMLELRNYIAELSKPVANQSFSGDDVKQLIEESIEGSKRVKDIVLNLRNFSRLDEAEFKPADIHEGLESTLMLLNNELKNRIDVHKNYGDIPIIECLPGYLNQVFMNLLLNASQAIDDKGNIWITTKLKDPKIEIAIRDDGSGISKEAELKIFDPFFTTKSIGAGTGLGLSISYGIIERHGGSIAVDSLKGKGTTFIITLPVKHHNREKSDG